MHDTVPTPAVESGTADYLRRAGRMIDDPVQLARAARIIRGALARERITLADLTSGDDERTPR